MVSCFEVGREAAQRKTEPTSEVPAEIRLRHTKHSRVVEADSADCVHLAAGGAQVCEVVARIRCETGDVHVATSAFGAECVVRAFRPKTECGTSVLHAEADGEVIPDIDGIRERARRQGRAGGDVEMGSAARCLPMRERRHQNEANGKRGGAEGEVHCWFQVDVRRRPASSSMPSEVKRFRRTCGCAGGQPGSIMFLVLTLDYDPTIC